MFKMITAFVVIQNIIQLKITHNYSLNVKELASNILLRLENCGTHEATLKLFSVQYLFFNAL